MSNEITVIEAALPIADQSTALTPQQQGRGGFTQADFDSFIKFLQVTPKTSATYTRAIRQLIAYLSANGRALLVGETILIHATREDILNFKEELQATGHKPTTITAYITAARLFFQWLEQEGICENVCAHIKGAKIDKGHKRDYLTSAQVKAVLSGIERDTLQGLRDYAMLCLIVCDGLRTIEVSRANIGDLRTAGDSTVLYVQGKGHLEKTEFVKVSAPVEAALRAYLKARGERAEEAPLFSSLSNNSKGGRMSTRSISGVCKKRMQDAGYDSERLTAHSLRHTAVTLSLLAGRPLEEVKQFARHANLETTLIYAHHLDKAANKCAEAVSDAIF